MRTAIATTVVMGMLVAGCGKSVTADAKADARAAHFVPPSVLSRLDYGGVVERRFHALDRNGDEAIVEGELPRQDSRLMKLDRNGDGKITANEWSDGMLARFDHLDQNHDGSLTSDEREAMRGR